MNNLISVIVPCYNAEKTIDRCIESVVTQTYRNWELIIIDDGSSDSSAELVSRWLEKDCRIRYYAQKNAGVSHARNQGIEKSQGVYIAFLDADDWYENSYLEIMYREICSNDCNVACSAYSLKNQEGGHAVIDESASVFQNSEFLKKIFFSKSIQGFVCNKLFLREMLINYRFDESLKLCEDLMLLCTMYKNESLKMSYIAEPLYNYWYVGQGASSSENVIRTEEGAPKIMQICELIVHMFYGSEKRIALQLMGERWLDCISSGLFSNSQLKRQAVSLFPRFIFTRSSIKNKIKFMYYYFI